MVRVRRMWWSVATVAVLLALAFGGSAVMLAFAGVQTIHMSDDCWTSPACRGDSSQSSWTTSLSQP